MKWETRRAHGDDWNLCCSSVKWHRRFVFDDKFFFHFVRRQIGRIGYTTDHRTLDPSVGHAIYSRFLIDLRVKIKTEIVLKRDDDKLCVNFREQRRRPATAAVFVCCAHSEYLPFQLQFVHFSTIEWRNRRNVSEGMGQQLQFRTELIDIESDFALVLLSIELLVNVQPRTDVM